MESDFMPSEVTALCCVLRAAGHLAYPVGGCVRDLLLHRTPEDWDIATSAQPVEVCACFTNTVTTGVKHGTVTVLLGNQPVQVTTFPCLGDYTDGRHPDAVSFNIQLTDDLAQRDFTMNAMALDGQHKLIDPLGGQIDLRARLIRCVGKPTERFDENAQLMLRAIRFSAQLGFAIEENTGAALRRAARWAARVPVEQVRIELEKVLLSPWPERGEGLFQWGLLKRFLARKAAPDLTTLHRVAVAPLQRWAALVALLMECRCIKSVTEFLDSLRLDQQTIDACTTALVLYCEGLPDNDSAWRHALRLHGITVCTAAAAMGDALTGSACAAQLTAIGAIVPNHAKIGGAF